MDEAVVQELDVEEPGLDFGAVVADVVEGEPAAVDPAATLAEQSSQGGDWVDI